MFAFLSLTTLTGSRGSSGGVVNRLPDSIPCRSKRFFFSCTPSRLTLPLPSSVLFSGCWSFISLIIKQLSREADHSAPSGSEVQKPLPSYSSAFGHLYKRIANYIIYEYKISVKTQPFII